MTINYSNTQAAINHLLDYLKCDHCSGTLHNPYSLSGSCEHILCSTCADPDNDNFNKGCPVCSIPVSISDIRPQQQWQHLVLQLRRLQKLISTHQSDKILIQNEESLPSCKESIDKENKCNAIGKKRLSSVLSDSHLEKGSKRLARSNSSRSVNNSVPTTSKKTVLETFLSNSANKRRLKQTEQECDDLTSTNKDKVSRSSSRKLNSKTNIECHALPMEPPKILPAKKKGPSQSPEVTKFRKPREDTDLLSEVLNVRSNLRKVKLQNELPDNSPETPDDKQKTLIKPSDVKKQQKSQSVSNLKASSSTESTLGAINSSKSANTSASSNKALNESQLQDKKINKRNQRGETQLHQAAIKGNLPRLNELIKAGATVNTQDNAGWTPLHEVVNRNFVQCAESLLRAGASVDIYGGPDSDTPLHDAVDNGSVECIKLLMKYGADKTRPNVKGVTPESLASPWPVLVNALDVQPDPDATRLSDVPLWSERLSSHNISPVNSQALVLLSSGLDRKQRANVSNMAHSLNGKVEDSMKASVTHLIVSTVIHETENVETCARTLKYLQSLLRGIWILKYDWLQNCAALSTRVLEEGFEISGCSTHPNSQSSRRARISLAKGEPRLLSGQSILLYGEFEYPSLQKKEFLLLLYESGACVYDNIEDIDSNDLTPAANAGEHSPWSVPVLMVVQEPKKKSQPFKSNNGIPFTIVTPNWLLDVIASYHLP